MLEHIKRVLDNAGVVPEDAAALAAHVGHAIRARGYRFLADTARAYSAQPPDAWDGVIEMVDK